MRAGFRPSPCVRAAGWRARSRRPRRHRPRRAGRATRPWRGGRSARCGRRPAGRAGTRPSTRPGASDRRLIVRPSYLPGADRAQPGQHALPGASAGWPRRSGAISTSGGGPSPSQSTGRAIASPSVSVPVMLHDGCLGQAPGRGKRRCPAGAIAPPPSGAEQSAQCRPQFGPDPEFPGDLPLADPAGEPAMKARIASRVGRAPGGRRVGRLGARAAGCREAGAPLPPALRAGWRPTVSPRSHAWPAFLAAPAFLADAGLAAPGAARLSRPRFLRRRLRPPLALQRLAALGQQRHRVIERHVVDAHVLRQVRDRRTMLRVRTEPPFLIITGCLSFGCGPRLRTLSSFLASASTARLMPTDTTSSSLSSEA